MNTNPRHIRAIEKVRMSLSIISISLPLALGLKVLLPGAETLRYIFGISASTSILAAMWSVVNLIKEDDDNWFCFFIIIAVIFFAGAVYFIWSQNTPFDVVNAAG